MQVTLLGPVSCRHEDRELPLGGLKQRAVFALLALEPGRIVSMDRLIDELWPDDPPAQAVVTLRAYVSRIRRVLEPTPARVTTRAPGWMLTLEAGATDLSRFTELLTRGRAALTAGGPDEVRSAVADLDAALDLWSGDALGDLAELQFAREEATRLEELHDAAVETLLDARLAAGDHEVVVERARRFVAERPFRERAWCALMIALYRSGRQAEALEAYGSLRRTLDDELGLDPSPALQELERRLLRQDPTLLASVSPAPGARIKEEPPAVAPDRPAVDPSEDSRDPVRTVAGWPVVGRAGPLAALRAAVGAAARGHGGLVVISAPLGAGKTTVLQALEDEMTAAGGHVLHGRGLADGAAPVLWPWVTVLRDLVDVLPTVADDRWTPDEPAAAALAAMGPAPTGGALEQAVPLSRSLLFRGVIDLLREARTHGPLAVLVDDAHWVDADTRTLLALACEELAEQGVLFVAAVRSDEPGQEVGRALSALRRELVRWISLQPLAEADVATLIAAIDGQEAPPGVAAAVLARTGGNALFVTELVRLLSAERRLSVAEVAQALPAEVLDVLGRRLDRLPPTTGSLLGVTALFAPGPFDLDLLSRVSGLDPELVLDSCETALLAGLLVDAADGTGRFALSHGLVRETLVARLSGARRVHLHAKIAAALQQRGPEQPDEVLEVARQLVLAGPAVGPAAAIPYLVSAAEDALRRSATSTARGHLARALELVAGIPDARVQESMRALVQGQLDTLRMWAASLDDDGSDRPPGDLAVPTDGPSVGAWLGTVVAWAVRGHYGWAIAEASSLLAGRPVPLAANAARFVHGYLSLLAGDPQSARHDLDLLDEAVRSGGEVHVPGPLVDLVGDVYAYRALLEHQAGDDAAADVEIVELVRWAAVSEESQMKGDCYLALIAAMRGDPDGARGHAERCLRLARRHDLNVFELQLAQVQAWAAALDGDPAGPARLDTASAAFWASGIHFLEPTYLALAAEAYAHHGEVETARRRARASLTRAGELGEHYLGPRLAALVVGLTDPATAPTRMAQAAS